MSWLCSCDPSHFLFQSHMIKWSSAVVSFQHWSNKMYNKSDRFSIKFGIHNIKLIFPAKDIRSNMVCGLEPFEREICHMTDENVQFTAERKKMQQLLHPLVSPSHQCSVMLLSNLAEVQWATIPCDRSLLPNIVCFQSFSSSQDATTGSSTTSCGKSEILLREKCISFLPQGYSGHMRELCLQKQRANWLSTVEIQIHLVKDIIAATHIRNLTFSIVIKTKTAACQTTWLYQKQYFLPALESQVHTKHLDESKLFVCITPLSEYKFPNLITFHCNETFYFSTVFVCQANIMCPTETLCLCEVIKEYAHLQCEGQRCFCARLFFTNRKGKLLSYLHYNNRSNSLLSTEHHTNVCENEGSKIHPVMNDLIADCGIVAADEPVLRNILVYMAEYPCSEPDQIPCFNRHSTCFRFNDTCIYRTNSLDHLIPCRTGAHLQECSLYSCNKHVKCPGHYCVPWGYTCDGKWDCPEGEDERVSFQCSKRICKDMFKCAQSKLCLHPLDICDGFADCPLSDDEYLCNFKDLSCPCGCLCLNMAITCASVRTQFSSFSFISYHLTHCVVIGIDAQLKQLFLQPHTVNLNITNCNLTRVCFFRGETESETRLLDMSSNQIQLVTVGCFSNFSKSLFLSLAYNQIRKIEPHSFLNISSLYMVNLQDNVIETLPKDLFEVVSKIHFLNLINNPLFDVDYDVFDLMSVGAILTSKYGICCQKPHGSKCTAPISWNTSCSMLFPTVVIQVMYGLVALCLMLVSGVSILRNVIHVYRNKLGMTKNKEVGPYNLIRTAIDVGSLLCGLYLLILFFASVHYSHWFFLKTDEWIKSNACQTAFVILLLFSFELPALMFVLSLSRCMVTKYPLHSKYKCGKFVFKVLVATSALCIGLCVTFLLLYRFVQTVLTSLCSPFLDPTNSLWVVKALCIFIFFWQGASIFSVAITSVVMICALKQSQEDSGIKKSIAGPSIQVICLVTGNIIGWIPLGLLHLVTTFSTIPPIKVCFWVYVTLLPLNPVLISLVFIFVILKKKCSRNLWPFREVPENFNINY